MVLCAVVKCSNRSIRDSHVSYFRFPRIISNKGDIIKETSMNRQKEWLSRINRANVTESNLKYKRVCSEHFIRGKPSSLLDVTNPDWAPSLKLGHSKYKVNGDQATERYASFPKDENRRKAWLEAIQRKNWLPSRCSKLCSAHFEEAMIDRTSLQCVRIRDTAVPTIFQTSPSHRKKYNRKKSSTAQTSVCISPPEAEIVSSSAEDSQVSEVELAMHQTLVDIAPFITKDIPSTTENSEVFPAKLTMFQAPVDLAPFETEGLLETSINSQVSPDILFYETEVNRLNDIIDKKNEKIKVLQKKVLGYEKKIKNLKTLFSDMEDLTYSLISS